MILYVNGDSHAAAAEAVKHYGWACDDGNLQGVGKEPHPANDAVSFGRQLATQLGWEYVNQSQAGGSNPRIIRTTHEWLATQSNFDNVFLLIQWSTWERQEWLHDGEYYQVNASGTDQIPQDLQDRYKQYIVDIDWSTCTQQAHQIIWEFHCWLNSKNIKHLFFNGNSHFGGTHLENNLTLPIFKTHQNWGRSYIAPYDPDQTYNSTLIKHGFETVNPKSWHFGANAHCFWAKYLLQYMFNNQLVTQDEILAN